MAAGVTVAVFEAGLEAADAPAIVLVHGMGHWTQAAWDLLAPEFEATHRIVAFDLPGFGASGKPKAAYTLAFFTAALYDVVEAAGLRRFALVGHSLGGMIAAEFASRHPARIRLLGLIAPAGFLRTPALALRIAASRPVLWLLGLIRPTRRLVNNTLDLAVYDRSSIPADQRERAFALSQDPAVTRAFFSVYAGAAKDLARARAMQARFARWRGPTALVWGRQDRYVPIRALATARRVYPSATVLEIDRCGHCPNLEYPRLVANALLESGA
jgi:4,5:9,10-diseco-3-hydroxy-5,9,17-trioxoandrosta-1(10),2-diene-4-oate hydrolase